MKTNTLFHFILFASCLSNKLNQFVSGFSTSPHSISHPRRNPDVKPIIGIKNEALQAHSPLASISALASVVSQKTSKKPTVPIARRPLVESGVRYRSDDWLGNFLSIPNSFVLRRIRFHLLSNFAVALLVTIIHKLTPMSIIINNLQHGLIGGYLSLLLAYRTNSAYARYWEGRGHWSTCMSKCRNLAMLLSTHIAFHSPKSAKRLLELVVAYPDALVDTCLCGCPSAGKVVLDTIGFDRSKTRTKLEPCTILCNEMQKALHDAAEESPTSGSNHLEALHLAEVSHDIASLVTLSSSCRKLARTPVPLSYSRHTSRFLTIWCGTLPFALVDSLGWFTPFLVSVICWCLFGIEEIGHLIEQPFVGDTVVDSVEALKSSNRKQGQVTHPYDIGLPVARLGGFVRDEVKDIIALNYVQ